MGKRERYEPGTFSWVELATTDGPAAKEFYSSLLGWETFDSPVGDGAVYTICLIDGDPVAALSERVDSKPSWLSYVTVEDVDETGARARELGGDAAEPFDVLDVGRMALVQDPQGAAFALWQPRAHIGAHRVNDVGCFCWNHLRTSDPESASAFYSALLGWELDGEGTAKVGGHDNGSIGGIAPSTDAPTEWLVWFTVASLDDALAAVAEGGGEVVRPKAENPVGEFALVRDPQGAVFFLFEGQVDD